MCERETHAETVQTSRPIEKQRDRQTDRQTDRDRQKPEKETDIKGNTETDKGRLYNSVNKLR